MKKSQDTHNSSANASRSESTIILEELEDNYEPTEEEILEYAQYLGMNLTTDQEFFWIAKEGLKAPVPKPWKPCRTPKGNIYYFNFESGQSSWEHPMDAEFKKKYKQEKEKKNSMIRNLDRKLEQEMNECENEFLQKVKEKEVQKDREIMDFKAKLISEINEYESELEKNNKSELQNYQSNMRDSNKIQQTVFFIIILIKNKEFQLKIKSEFIEKQQNLREKYGEISPEKVKSLKNDFAKKLEIYKTDLEEKRKNRVENIKIKQKLHFEDSINVFF